MKHFIRKKVPGHGPALLVLTWTNLGGHIRPVVGSEGGKMRHFIKKKVPGHGPGPFPVVVGATTTRSCWRNNYANNYATTTHAAGQT